MKYLLSGSICTALFLGGYLICGCSSTPAPQQRPTETFNVNNALEVNGLTNVQVAENRSQGVMTLTGTVTAQDQKAQAGQIAHINAPDYSIVNNITVAQAAQTASSNAIEDKYKAMLKADTDLERQPIDYKAKDATLVLSGTVHSAHERAEAVEMARSVPDVKQVVDDIKVK